MARRLTKSLMKRACDRIRRGAYIAQAFEAEGIPRRTVYDALRAGRREREEGRRTWRVDLVRKVETAEALAEGDLVDAARSAAEVDGRIATDLLGRRFRDRWSPKLSIDVGAQFTAAMDALEREFASEPQILERALRAISEGPTHVIDAHAIEGGSGAAVPPQLASGDG
jgi:hypothetical protein